jgi:hypothetical protein
VLPFVGPGAGFAPSELPGKIRLSFSSRFNRTPAMTIKSDKWIRRMAQEHGMIEPFVERQVRGADDSRVISYGVSSYGYDVLRRRIQGVHQHPLGRPEELRRGSFVDIKSDVCIIPPNSFALARTVEYFRIPRDVLTICLGKSTYALRHHRQRPAGAGVGRSCDPGVLQHHQPAGEDLRPRRRGADAVPAVGRSLRESPTRTVAASTRARPA